MGNRCYPLFLSLIHGSEIRIITLLTIQREKVVQFKRRNFLKGVLASGAAPLAVAESSRQHPPKMIQPIEIRPGYYCVDGVVVTEAELRGLREEGLC